MSEMMVSMGVSVGIPLVLWAIAKFAPKEMLIAKVGPIFFGLGMTLSKILNLKLGEKNAEKVENGFFKTIVDVGKCVFDQFWSGLSKDNKEKVE